MDWKKNGSQELEIASPNGLDPEEYKVYEAFTDYINSDVNRAVTEYAELDSQDGRILNTDIARELSEHYRRDPIQWTEAVHEPASSLVKEIFRRRLRSRELNDQLRKPWVFLLLGGGPGAGKTTGTEVVAGNVYRVAHSVYDSTLANIDSTEVKLQEVLNANKVAYVAYIHCPILTAVNRAFLRGLRTGRVVPVDVLIECHMGAQECIRYLSDTYRNHKRVELIFVDNSGSKDKICEFEDIRAINFADPVSKSELITQAVKIIHEQEKRHRKDSYPFDTTRVARSFQRNIA